MTKHARGEVREDGRMFWVHQVSTGKDVWLHPVAFFIRSSETYRKQHQYRQLRAGRPLRAPKLLRESPIRKDIKIGDVDSEGRYFLGYCSSKREAGLWGTAENLRHKREAARKAVAKCDAKRFAARDMKRGWCRFYPKTKIIKPKPVPLTPEQREVRHREARARGKANERRRRRADPVLRAMHCANMRLRHFTKGRGGYSGVGCKRAFFMTWISAQFVPGMSWDNYGSVWHLDHLLPQAWFKAFPEARRYLMNHYTNLRPLFSADNVARGDFVLRKDFSLVLARMPDEYRNVAHEVAQANTEKLEKLGPDLPPTQGPQSCTC